MTTWTKQDGQSTTWGAVSPPAAPSWSIPAAVVTKWSKLLTLIIFGVSHDVFWPLRFFAAQFWPDLFWQTGGGAWSILSDAPIAGWSDPSITNTASWSEVPGVSTTWGVVSPTNTASWSNPSGRVTSWTQVTENNTVIWS